MKRSLLLCLLLLPVLAGAQDFDALMRKAGLVDVTTLDPTIQVRLMYSTTDNFVGKDVYGDLETAYLYPEFAQMTAAAQAKLQQLRPGYTLVILDAARPMSVQREFFRIVAGTPQNIYVANPAKGGGRHNYGAAVDVTILDAQGEALDMGTAFDHFGYEANVGDETKLVKQGKITRQAADNRALLYEVMLGAGFQHHPKEWWHYHKYTIPQLQKKYKLLDF